MLLSFGGQLTLGLVTVALALSVLLVCIFDGNLFAQQILPVHGRPSSITGLERTKTDETIALGDVVVVSDNVGLSKDLAELAECVVQDLLVDLRIEVVDEELGSNVDRLLLICARLIHADRLSPDPDSVEDLRCVFGGSGGIELDEAVTLMCLRHSILRHVYLAYGADLRHEFGKQLLGEALVDVADVYGCIFVLFPNLRVSKGAIGASRPATVGRQDLRLTNVST